MLSNDPRYIGRIRALAAQVQRNDTTMIKTRQAFIQLTASDARISAEVHALAAAFCEKVCESTVPASARVWSDIDDEIERQKSQRKTK